MHRCATALFFSGISASTLYSPLQCFKTCRPNHSYYSTLLSRICTVLVSNWTNTAKRSPGNLQSFCRFQGKFQLCAIKHPRLRGEDPKLLLPCGMVPGSPPLARGRRMPSVKSSQTGRLTPACAGKTRIWSGKQHQDQAHPRLRGEDPNAESNVPDGLGSPPLARGRRPLFFSVRPATWLTPACAGKTQVRKQGIPRRKAHPRLRGEDAAGSLGQLLYSGSPPLARGRHGRPELLHRRVGLTPACAGKTTLCKITRQLSKAHPRLRGEDAARYVKFGLVLGSPPLARGRL